MRLRQPGKQANALSVAHKRMRRPRQPRLQARHLASAIAISRSGGRIFEVGGPNFEVGGSNIRGQGVEYSRSEVQISRSEGRILEVGGPNFEVGGPNFEVGGSKFRGRRSKFRGWRSKFRGRGVELRGLWMGEWVLHADWPCGDGGIGNCGGGTAWRRRPAIWTGWRPGRGGDRFGRSRQG